MADNNTESNSATSGETAPQDRRANVAVALHRNQSPELSVPGSTTRILASGRGAIAEQILEIAFAQGVKVRQDADLAEVLAMVDAESEIPLEAIAAVAEILSYVYRANGRVEPAT